MIGLGLDGYDPDSRHDAAVAFRIRVVAQEQYIPRHQHRKGQLILALGSHHLRSGKRHADGTAPVCRVDHGQMPHSNKATPGAQLCFLFIEPGAVSLPDRCCTLKISSGAGTDLIAGGKIT